jgi:molybdopterin synthase sulfur carrier subunit
VIRIVLPAHLRTLARVGPEVQVEIEGQATQESVLDALEASYPMLRGTLRDYVSHKRRPFVRFFACEQDLSHESPDTPLPEAVASGAEPFLVVGAIAGGADDPLASYLHDHLAGSNFAIELLKNLKEEHAGEPLGDFAAAELPLLLEDRGIVQEIADRTEAPSSPVKEAATWLAEKASRFKLRHPSSREFGDFEALELLAIGVHGRVGLWRALARLATGESSLGEHDFDALANRAQQQHDRVEEQRVRLAPSALRPRN